MMSAFAREARYGGTDFAWIESEVWRRRESNPRPKVPPRGILHAYPFLNSHGQREETAKNRRPPDSVILTVGRRATIQPPARLMASDPQPPGEAGADAHSLLSCESVLIIRS